MLLGLHKNKQRLLCSALLLSCFGSQAQTTQDEQAPSMALLEYLAELEEVDGELVGPMDMSPNEQQNNSDEHNNTDSESKPAKPKEDKPCVGSC